MSVLQFVRTGVLLDILNVFTAAVQPGSVISPAFPTHSHYMKFEWQPNEHRAEAISKLSHSSEERRARAKQWRETKNHPHAV